MCLKRVVLEEGVDMSVWWCVLEEEVEDKGVEVVEGTLGEVVVEADMREIDRSRG